MFCRWFFHWWFTSLRGMWGTELERQCLFCGKFQHHEMNGRYIGEEWLEGESSVRRILLDKGTAIHKPLRN